jgi:hypothetical protein
VSALERHFSIQEIATLWQLSEDKTRQLFRDRPDVLKLESPERVRPKKRGYLYLRVPESVVLKVHAELRGLVSSESGRRE